MSRSATKKAAKDKTTGKSSTKVSRPVLSASHPDLMALQDAAGNQAVSRLLQSSEEDVASVPSAVPSIVQDTVQSAGEPLDSNARAEMEASFGYDFGSVRVHRDGQADKSTHAIDAKAYTVGNHVVFGAGAYTPATLDGKSLLAHELAHVIQQKAGNAGNVEKLPYLTINDPGDVLEQNADRAANLVSAGISAQRNGMDTSTQTPLGQHLGASSGAIQLKRQTNTSTEQSLPPEISADIEEEMEADFQKIVEILDTWGSLNMEETNDILTIVEKYAKMDEDYRASSGYRGSDFLDKFLMLLWSRGAKDYVTAYDLILHKSRSYGKERFKRLVAKSHKRGILGPGEKIENFWKTLSKQEAIGIWGILKGMGTGAAGIVDTGAWGVTRMMQAAGLDVAEPESAAKWLEMQYDISGEAMFGKEWKEGQKLLFGMNAADIGNVGGGVIWNLTMIGAGSGASGNAKAFLTTLGIVGGLKGVEASAKNIAAIIKKKQTQGTLSASDLLADPEFLVEATKMGASIFGAVSAGTATNTNLSDATQKALKIAGVLVDGAECLTLVNKIVAIGTSNEYKTAAEKEKAVQQAVVELINKVTEIGGQAVQSRQQPAKSQPVQEGKSTARSADLEPSPVVKSEAGQQVVQSPAVKNQLTPPAGKQAPPTKVAHAKQKKGGEVVVEFKEQTAPVVERVTRPKGPVETQKQEKTGKIETDQKAPPKTDSGKSIASDPNPKSSRRRQKSDTSAKPSKQKKPSTSPKRNKDEPLITHDGRLTDAGVAFLRDKYSKLASKTDEQIQHEFKNVDKGGRYLETVIKEEVRNYWNQKVPGKDKRGRKRMLRRRTETTFPMFEQNLKKIVEKLETKGLVNKKPRVLKETVDLFINRHKDKVINVEYKGKTYKTLGELHELVKSRTRKSIKKFEEGYMERLRPDIVEVNLDKKRLDLTDPSHRALDLDHNFKSLIYKIALEEMTGLEVRAQDYKNWSNQKVIDD